MTIRKSTLAQRLLDEFLRGARPTFDQCVSVLAPFFPLLNDLEETPQDDEWHAEGNVHIHTSMVLQALYQEILDINQAGESLTPNEQLALFLGAILHDICKPVTTAPVEINGVQHIGARHHEKLGRSYVAQPLLELGLPYPVVRDIMALVGYHQVPKLLVAKEYPKAAYRQLARKVPARLVYHLERADMIGRHCKNKDLQLLYLDFFRNEMQELGIWASQPYTDWAAVIQNELKNHPDSGELLDLTVGSSILDYEAGLISSVHEGIARAYAKRQGFGRLYLLVGPSGSGKSTWATRTMPAARIISLDQLREEMTGSRSDQSMNGQVLQESKRLLKESLAAHETVVYDATSLRLDFRQPIIELGIAYGALITVVVVHRQTGAVLAGNSKRDHSVTSPVLTDQFSRCSGPRRMKVTAFSWLEKTSPSSTVPVITHFLSEGMPLEQQ